MQVGYSPEFVHIWVQTISPLHMYALALNSYGAYGGHSVPLNVGEPNKKLYKLKLFECQNCIINHIFWSLSVSRRDNSVVQYVFQKDVGSTFLRSNCQVLPIQQCWRTSYLVSTFCFLMKAAHCITTPMWKTFSMFFLWKMDKMKRKWGVSTLIS